MPSLITHALFADDLIDQMDRDDFKTYRHLFTLGANGPDFLFYHNALPQKAVLGSPLRSLGSQLHQGHVNEFYASLLDGIEKQSDPVIKEQMIVYACGHLSHWALDSTLHPYIYYRTGSCKGRSAWNHHRMESIIDALTLKMKRNQTTAHYDDSEEVANCSPAQMALISSVYAKACKDVFDKEIDPVLFAQSLQDWHDGRKMMRDKTGTKLKLLKLFEKSAGITDSMSGLIIPAKPEDNHDAFNLLHKTWKDPVTGEESTKSLLDLEQEAMDKAKTAIALFLDAVENPDKKQALLDFLDNRSYDTNICGGGKKKYFHVDKFD